MEARYLGTLVLETGQCCAGVVGWVSDTRDRRGPKKPAGRSLNETRFSSPLTLVGSHIHCGGFALVDADL